VIILAVIKYVNVEKAPCGKSHQKEVLLPGGMAATPKFGIFGGGGLGLALSIGFLLLLFFLFFCGISSFFWNFFGSFLLFFMILFSCWYFVYGSSWLLFFPVFMLFSFLLP
jgi:hypothetical protein